MVTRFYLDTSVAVHALHGTPSAEACALAVGGGIVVVSHDANVKRVARVLGLDAYDPH